MGISSALGGTIGAVPSGGVIPFAGSTAPAGWLLCAGQAVSRTEYAELFATISTTYGSGDGSTTFGLPDLRGRVVAGVDNMGGSAASRLTSTTITGGGDAVGEVGGSQTHTLTSGESGVPAHSHTASSNTTGSHTHQQHGNFGSYSGSAFLYGTNWYGAANGAATSSAGDHSHTITVNNNTAANASSAHNNVQPTMVLNYIIKA